MSLFHIFFYYQYVIIYKSYSDRSMFKPVDEVD